MAITQVGLQAQIETQLQAQGFALTDEHTYAYAQRLAIAISTAIVNHLSANLQISGVSTDSASGPSEHAHGLTLVVGGTII